jgi:Coenzyme PQQ synthesis protein D (PqqD)
VPRKLRPENKNLPEEKIPAKIQPDMMSSSARKLSGESTVVVSQDQVSCELGGEAAILNLKAGVYYGLNEVGARIWKLIHEPKRVSEIRDTILEEYQVEPEQCEVDVMVLLQALLDNGLIEEKNESIK